MGIENNTHEIEVQNQELQRANREQIEQANKEHEELGKVLDGLDTLDNEAELDEISGNEDISEQDDTVLITKLIANTVFKLNCTHN